MGNGFAYSSFLEFGLKDILFKTLEMLLWKRFCNFQKIIFVLFGFFFCYLFVSLQETSHFDVELFCYSRNVRQRKYIWTFPPTSGYKGDIRSNVTFTYDSAETYKGPVIRGWEPTKNRNSTVYVRPFENTIKHDPLECHKIERDRVDLVIMQHSAPKNFKVRMENRLTWMDFAKYFPEVVIIFVVGVPTVSPDDLDDVDLKVQKDLDKEFQTFGDILQVESYESYSNNSLKSLHAIKYILGIDWQSMSKSGKPPKFVMRSDDDVYINLPLVNKQILKEEKWSVSEVKPLWPPILGYIIKNVDAVRIPDSLMNETFAPKGMYECPTYFYRGDNHFPTYFQGSGYFIPWWALSCIYQESFQLPYFFIEDVFVSGWIADRCLVPKQHLPGFEVSGTKKPIDEIDKTSHFMFHYVYRDFKHQLHQRLMEEYAMESDFQ